MAIQYNLWMPGCKDPIYLIHNKDDTPDRVTLVCRPRWPAFLGRFKIDDYDGLFLKELPQKSCLHPDVLNVVMPVVALFESFAKSLPDGISVRQCLKNQQDLFAFFKSFQWSINQDVGVG